MNTRMEHDTMGEIAVPADHHWGAQTQRSFQNFAIGTETMPEGIIRAFALLKKAAALANRLIGEGLNFEEVCRALTDHNDAGHILFALASFENLAKAGRVSKVVGFIAGALNMRVLGRRTPDGKIDFFYKTRGETRVLARILEQMDLDGFDCSHTVRISHCGNEHAAGLLEHGIHAKWPQAEVVITPCAGLCSFYAQDQGLILTY